ncbi:MAG TPA: hypothetical protein VFV34_06300, partial [Blastocatellia bacterium]|nr:hypothetical protein [Blastocatellia bacterium]
DENVTIGYYGMAFIDLLSQKDVLRTIDRLPENKDTEAEFIDKWKQTIGVIKGFRGAFDSFYSGYMEKDTGAIPRATKEQLNLRKRFLTPDVKKQLFSDSMIYYASLLERPNREPIASIHALISGCAGVFLTALSLGFICRGGLEVGIAGEFFKGEIYGPALYHAYRLESEVAQYPRIAVGTGMIQYLADEARTPGDNDRATLRRALATRCRSWFCQDADGVIILDYAGPLAHETFPSEGDLVESAVRFATKEWNRFTAEQNHKLAARYFMLSRYITSRWNSVWKPGGT